MKIYYWTDHETFTTRYYTSKRSALSDCADANRRENVAQPVEARELMQLLKDRDAMIDWLQDRVARLEIELENALEAIEREAGEPKGYVVTYKIDVPPDYSAGLHGVLDTVQVIVESGDPGGEIEEFAEHIMGALVEWYDVGGGVYMIAATQEGEK